MAFKSLPKSVQPLVFDLHKFYLTALRPANKSLHMAEVITWIPQHLKTQYGISNFVRFSGEKEQPTSVTGVTSAAISGATRHVTTSGDTLQVTVDVSESTDLTGATAPQSPSGNVPVVEAV